MRRLGGPLVVLAAVAELGGCAFAAPAGDASDRNASGNEQSSRRIASEPHCVGRAKERKPEVIAFTFTCSGEDVTGFLISANQALRGVEDPEEVFGCERRNTRTFFCEDMHSGADEFGRAKVSLERAACSSPPALRLRVKPLLNFESTRLPAFTLVGPC